MKLGTQTQKPQPTSHDQILSCTLAVKLYVVLLSHCQAAFRVIFLQVRNHSLIGPVKPGMAH